MEKYKCVMLHPSKLPDFAGGSPLQNQIIRNIKKSAITLFVMNKKIDQGNIIAQKMIMLTGWLSNFVHLNPIFNGFNHQTTKQSQQHKKGNHNQSECLRP